MVSLSIRNGNGGNPTEIRCCKDKPWVCHTNTRGMTEEKQPTCKTSPMAARYIWHTSKSYAELHHTPSTSCETWAFHLCLSKPTENVRSVFIISIAEFQTERPKSLNKMCCIAVRTISNLKLPGSRPQKQFWKLTIPQPLKATDWCPSCIKNAQRHYRNLDYEFKRQESAAKHLGTYND